MEIKSCQNCKKDFVIESEDFDFYRKIDVPPPTFCPMCRMKRRFVWYNERSLFRRKESRTKEKIFSGLPPDAPLVVYERDYWWSDAWDPSSYGRDYDFTRSFFEQFYELFYEVPWPSRSVQRLVNSDYSNNASDLRNAYLCFNIDGGENSAYIIDGTSTKDSFDLYATRHAELSYDNYMADESYRVFFSTNIENCHEIWFSRNLIGCQNCFGCVNLRNKSYYVFNESYTKEAYADFMRRFMSGSYSAVEEMRSRTHAFWLKNPMRFTLGINNANSTGEHIEHSRNVRDSYSIHGAENLRYCQFLKDGVTNSYDYTSWGMKASLMYETAVVGHECSGMRFCYNCYNSCRELTYSAFCHSSSDLFACVGLRKKQYCILNRQYTKEEYKEMVSRIKQHMNEMPYVDSRGNEYRYGEFFPPEFSPFAYNETINQDYFPLSKEEAAKEGYVWREPEKKEYETTLDSKDLSDHIDDVEESVLREIIRCEECGKAYRIIAPELVFLKRIGLPLPRRCVNCRFKRRFRLVNPPQFWRGRCQCAGEKSDNGVYSNTAVSHEPHIQDAHCPNEFKTSYAPNRPEIVYCEQCYQAEVV